MWSDHEYPPTAVAVLCRLRGGFARSLATLNACTYVLGIGDRHLDNFLLDTTTGYETVTRFWVLERLRILRDRVHPRQRRKHRFALGGAGQYIWLSIQPCAGGKTLVDMT